MRVPEQRRAEVKAEGLRRIKRSNEDDARRFLLTNIIQTYLPLDEAQQAAFERMMTKEEYAGVPDMITTWAEQEREKGSIETSRKLVQAVLEKRFGPLTPRMLSTIRGWPLARLEEVLLALVDGKSLADLGLTNGNGASG
jgi:hypothetical protein